MYLKKFICFFIRLWYMTDKLWTRRLKNDHDTGLKSSSNLYKQQITFLKSKITKKISCTGKYESFDIALNKRQYCWKQTFYCLKICTSFKQRVHFLNQINSNNSLLFIAYLFVPASSKDIMGPWWISEHGYKGSLCYIWQLNKVKIHSQKLLPLSVPYRGVLCFHDNRSEVPLF